MRGDGRSPGPLLILSLCVELLILLILNQRQGCDGVGRRIFKGLMSKKEDTAFRSLVDINPVLSILSIDSG